MPEYDLLTVYALAVARMRALQQQRTPGEPLGHRRERERAEREVDDLTTLHLLPPLPEVPHSSPWGHA